MTATAFQGRQKGRPKVRRPPCTPPFTAPTWTSLLPTQFWGKDRVHFGPSTFLLSAHHCRILEFEFGGIPCASGLTRSITSGIRTGKCVAFNDTVQTCEIFGWCPVEVDDNIPR